MKCPHDPQELKGEPIGMYHCPVCGEMVIAGLPHEPEKDFTGSWSGYDVCMLVMGEPE